jgi:predicted MPP superfamily phosphohydrolase
MICHSPEQYPKVESAGFDLYLTGHTHGGQVCLPGGHILVKGASVPRKILKGKWRYHSMTGYTSRGVGSTSLPVRFFCPPEMTFITLKKSSG